LLSAKQVFGLTLLGFELAALRIGGEHSAYGILSLSKNFSCFRTEEKKEKY